MKKNGQRIIRELGSDNERRVKVQRYLCCECHHSYILRKRRRGRWSEAIEKEVVRRHVEGRESYRVIAKGIYERSGRKISATSVQKMVERTAERCKTPLEMSKALRPQWDGYLLVDEKMARVKGKQQWWYIGVDRTGDILHCRPVKELTVTEAIRFLEEVKGLPILCKGIVSDLDASLSLAIGHVFGEEPHQFCLKHAISAIEKHIGYKEHRIEYRRNQKVLREEFVRLPDRKGIWKNQSKKTFQSLWEETRGVSEHYKKIRALRDHCHRILFSSNEQMAEEQLCALIRARCYPGRERKRAIVFLQYHWDRLMAHHRVPGLPRTNNLVENVNKQLERRFKGIESFQHRYTAVGYVNLLIAYLRCKPYTDCRKGRKHLNGKSRLAAAKVRNLSPDWLKNCLK